MLGMVISWRNSAFVDLSWSTDHSERRESPAVVCVCMALMFQSAPESRSQSYQLVPSSSDHIFRFARTS